MLGEKPAPMRLSTTNPIWILWDELGPLQWEELMPSQQQKIKQTRSLYTILRSRNKESSAFHQNFVWIGLSTCSPLHNDSGLTGNQRPYPPLNTTTVWYGFDTYLAEMVWSAAISNVGIPYPSWNLMHIKTSSPCPSPHYLHTVIEYYCHYAAVGLIVMLNAYEEKNENVSNARKTKLNTVCRIWGFTTRRHIPEEDTLLNTV
jgi:hypothetical protein